jgi:hypothetical protein
MSELNWNISASRSLEHAADQRLVNLAALADKLLGSHGLEHASGAEGCAVALAAYTLAKRGRVPVV